LELLDHCWGWWKNFYLTRESLSKGNHQGEALIQAVGAVGKTFVFQESLHVGLAIRVRTHYRLLGELLSFRRLLEKG